MDDPQTGVCRTRAPENPVAITSVGGKGLVRIVITTSVNEALEGLKPVNIAPRPGLSVNIRSL